MEDLKAWNCIEAPLLLQMEKELEDEVNCIGTIKLLLRRTFVRSVILFGFFSLISQIHTEINL